MTNERPSARHRPTDDADADAVLAACRVLVGLSARSIAAVEDVADVAQVRALVVISSRGSVSLGELAVAANLHLTRASRLCDRMVAQGLVRVPQVNPSVPPGSTNSPTTSLAVRLAHSDASI